MAPFTMLKIQRIRLKFVSEKLTICDLVDFGDAPVFEAIAYASILIGLKRTAPEEHAIRACTWPLSEGFTNLLQTLNTSRITLAQADLAADGWRLENPASIRLLEKLQKPANRSANTSEASFTVASSPASTKPSSLPTSSATNSSPQTQSPPNSSSPSSAAAM